MKKYRIYFIKNGIKLTKLVNAESMTEVFSMFKGVNILLVKEIDSLPLEDEI